jgi:hypothetical protein
MNHELLDRLIQMEQDLKDLVPTKEVIEAIKALRALIGVYCIWSMT